MLLVLTACGGDSGDTSASSGNSGDTSASSGNSDTTNTLSFPLGMFMVSAGDGPISTQIASGGQSTGEISYKSDDTTVATVDAMTGIVTIVGIGTVMITATRAGDANYKTIEASYTLTVVRRTDIDILSFPSVMIMATFGDQPVRTQIASGGQSTGEISYKSDDTTVATVDAMTGIVTIVGVGTAMITATRAVDASYEATEASYLLAVALATDTLRFPAETLLLTVGADPITTQIATTGQGSGAISYESDDTAVATVGATTGVVTIIGEGTAMITATRAMDAHYEAIEASYSLNIIDDTLSFTQFDVGDRGRDVCITYYYTSGRIESICEHIGIEALFGLDCDGDGLKNTRVLQRFIAHGLGGDFEEDGCVPTDKDYPDLPPLDPATVAQNLQGAMSFSPTYITDHGAVVETTTSAETLGSATTNKYASGLVETTVVEQFREDQLALDYNNDGDFVDFVHLSTVALDYSLHTQQLQILTERGGTVLEDFVRRTTNAPRRINMPTGIANFLRFNGALDDIVIQIATTTTAGEYYVKIESNDPSVQLIIQRTTAVPGAGPLVEDLRPDFFERTPLINNTTTSSYAIYAVKGELYRTVLPQYPNFYVRYDFENFLIPTLLQKALDENRSIAVNANAPAFLDYYDNIRVEFDPLASSSYFIAGSVFISSAHVYVSRPLIHEVAHGYHENFYPGGPENEEVKALYALVPSDLSMKYGDEQNSYWRTNHNEFYAEALTTWLHIESGVVLRGFDPITQVDSTFYYAQLKPWFDNHFNKN